MIDFELKLKEDQTYEIRRYIGESSEVNIPQLINNKEVTSIGESAFEDCNCTTIIIPATVKNIENYAFFGCNIEKATIPSIAISSIKNSKLKEVIITTGNEIGDSAFAGCSNLTSIIISDNVTSIGNYAFQDCTTLTSIRIPHNVISIGIGAFSFCNSLRDITIPDNVTSIRDYAFLKCENLTNVTIPNSVQHIGLRAFSGCSNLNSITYKEKEYADINEVINLVNKQES